MSKINWLEIKNEYINTKTSYRKLADKYSVSFATIRARAKLENWVNLREKQQHKISTKIAQKTQEIIVTSEVDRLSNLLSLTDKLTPKIEKAINQLDIVLVDGDIISADIIDTYRLRQIVQSIKDLKDIVKDVGDDENIEDISDAESDVFEK